MKEVFVVAARRTAVGKAPRGSLRHTRPDDLGAAVVKALVAGQPDLDPARLGDVIMGCAMPEGEQGMNVSRNIGLLAGLPDTVPGMTVNRFCSSGLETIAIGAMVDAAMEVTQFFGRSATADTDRTTTLESRPPRRRQRRRRSIHHRAPRQR